MNFGTHILSWDLEQLEGSDEQVPTIMALRHFLELIDSVSILVKHSSIDPCKIILRGALETYFGLEYIFEKDTTDRCMAFLVWHSNKNLKNYKKFDPTTQQGKQLKNSLNNDKSINGMDISNIPELNPAINNLESILQRPEYQKAEQEYQRLRSAGERNPPWYRFFDGPKNIKELADHLEHSGLYELLYRSWSGPIHGTDIFQGKLSGLPDQSNGIIQIRYPKDAQSVTSFALSLSLMVFTAYIDNRIPDRMQSFHQWYNKTIRDLYLRVTSEEQLLKVKK